jgi:predicted secreted protein
MSEVLAYACTIEVSSDGGTTYNTVGEVQNPKLTDDSDILDVTANDDAGWKAKKAGLKAYNLSFDVNYDVSNTGQTAIRTAAEGNTELKWRVRPEGNVSGKRQYIFDSHPKIDLDLPSDNVAKMSVECESNGSVAVSTIT